MSILSYNQINELFNQVAIAHYQIKRFGSGELSEADINKFISENQEYPVLWMTPVSVTTNSNVLLYNLNLLVFDLVNKDKDNEREVLSDCLQIALDVVRILRYGNAEFNIVTEPNISPFAGRYSDWVAGWSLEIELEVDIQSNNCDIPYEGLDLTQVLQSFVAEGEPGFQCIDLEGCELIINLQSDVATALNNTITGGTYNSGTTNLTLTTLDGSEIIITGITAGGGSNFNCDALANCDIITGLTGDVQTIFSSITGTSGQVAYFNNNNALTGDTYFTRNPANFDTNITATEDPNTPGGRYTTYSLSYLQSNIQVIDDNTSLTSNIQSNSDGIFFNVYNVSGNTASGMDALETAGSFRFTDNNNGLYNGFFYVKDKFIGYNTNDGSTQYDWYLPTGAPVVGSVLTDVTGSGNLSWVVPTDTYVTGGTYTNGDAIFTNNKGGGFTVSGFPIGGGGGKTFYLNLSEAKNGNRYLSTTASTAAEQSTGATIAVGGTGTIASFQSDVLNTTLIPGGIWAFYLHSYKSNSNASFNIFVEVYKRASGGTETLLFTTDPTAVTTNSPNPSMGLSDAYFSGSPILVSDSIVAVVRATNTSNQSHTVTLFSEGSQHYSYAVSTLPTQQGLTCDTLSGCSVIQTIQTDVSTIFSSITGTPQQVAYYNTDGNLTGDTFFTRQDEANNHTTEIIAKLGTGYTTTLGIDAGLGSLTVIGPNSQTQLYNTEDTAKLQSVDYLTNDTYTLNVSTFEAYLTYENPNTGLSSGFAVSNPAVSWIVNNGITNYQYTLPSTPFLKNGVLTDTNGNGNLSWVKPQTNGNNLYLFYNY